MIKLKLTKYIEEELNKNKNVYFIAADIKDADKLTSLYKNYSNFHVLDVTDICIETNFKSDDVIVVDKTYRLMQKLLNHRINFFA